MLNERLEAAHAVRDSFLPLKKGADELALHASKCLVIMQTARSAAGLPLGAGAEPLADIARGAALLYEAEKCFAAAHPKLADLIRDAGLGRFYAYGDDECPPASGSVESIRPLVRAA